MQYRLWRTMTWVGSLALAVLGMSACDTNPLHPFVGYGGGYGAGPGATPGDTTDGSTSVGTSTGCFGCGGGSVDFSDGGPLPPPPLDMSPVVLAATPPPPLSGGTMLIASDGATAVAADPDRDTVWWTNTNDLSFTVHSVALQAGDEPGRVVQDGAGLVHVALRRAGAVATIDLSSGSIVRRTPVCPAPRGLAYDAANDAILVACVGGELVTLAASNDAVQRSVQIDQDLRDVVPLGGGLLAVSRFRNAEILLVDGAGVVRTRSRLNAVTGEESTAAWRMVAVPNTTSVAVVHQLATTQPVQVQAPGGYGQGGKESIVTSALSVMQFFAGAPDQTPTYTTMQLQGGLPVDVSVNADGSQLVVALYASQLLNTVTLSAGGLNTPTVWKSLPLTSVAFTPAGRTVGFVREPGAFSVFSQPGSAFATIPFTAPSVRDTGHDLFHTAAGAGEISCASCHPEGRDDGHVWQFVGLGARRTPSLVGGVMETAPFHWDGSLTNLDALMTEVFTKRMGGLSEDSAHVAAVARFLDAIPRVPIAPPPTTAAYQHGKDLFESADVGCTTCHSGPHLTNNATLNVGTGAAFQVPTLIGVGLRAPYLHDGRAPTLTDRFGPSGGGDMHGHTSQLSPSDISDLVTYLGSL